MSRVFKVMAAGLLLTASNPSLRIDRVLTHLDDYDVEVVLGVRSVVARLAVDARHPAVLVTVVHSQQSDCMSELEDLLLYSVALPIIVVDQAFQSNHGAALVARGAQDYLDASQLNADEFCRRIELAVLRHRPDRKRFPADALPAKDWKELWTVLQSLPSREREVLDLLIAGVIPKRIASRLGTKCQTVINQITRLREKFGADTREQLVIFVLHTMYQEANGL